jgi:hypothetical protein
MISEEVAGLVKKFCAEARKKHPDVFTWTVTLFQLETRVTVRIGSTADNHMRDEWLLDAYAPDVQAAIVKAIEAEFAATASETPYADRFVQFQAVLDRLLQRQETFVTALPGIRHDGPVAEGHRTLVQQAKLGVLNAYNSVLTELQLLTDTKIEPLARVVQTLRSAGVKIDTPYDFENWIADNASHSQLFATKLFKEEE